MLLSKAKGDLNGQSFERINMIKDFNRFDYGMVAGVGVSVLGFYSLQFDYNFGMAELQNSSDIMNRSWEITLSIVVHYP